MRAFIVCTILVFCCLAIGCKGFAFRVPSKNMQPAINPGDTCIVNQHSEVDIQRFDIVMFKAPEVAKKISQETGDVKYISRIIGLPNEKIEIKDSKVFIDDKLLNEPFEKFTGDPDQRKNVAAAVIPENEYFVMGDNRPFSFDSRSWSPATVKKKDVLGKIIEILPLDVKK
jgi:signal peptidase I